MDVNGEGTLHHVHNVEPFVLLDVGTISKKGHPPFGQHPHYRVSATTYLVSGGGMEATDNVSKTTTVNLPGGFYAASAHRGVVHEEKTIDDTPTTVTERRGMKGEEE